jgi:hypothetical protein
MEDSEYSDVDAEPKLWYAFLKTHHLTKIVVEKQSRLQAKRGMQTRPVEKELSGCG